MLYFAYGSNMPTKQIRKSDKNAVFRGVAELRDYRLVFSYWSRGRKCGVADVVSCKDESVWGVLWEVSAAGFQKLDVREGFPKSYNRKCIVVSRDGHDVECIAYTVVKRNGPYTPNSCYLGLLIAGASEHKLPASYVDKLRQITTAESE